MSGSLSPFRITPEDLPDLDSKTRNGLAPLLDALNVSVQQLFAAAQAVPAEQSFKTSFTSDAGGLATVSFSPQLPQAVSKAQLDWFQRSDRAPITTVYSFSMNRTDSGLSQLLFAGLSASTKYDLSVTFK